MKDGDGGEICYGLMLDLSILPGGIPCAAVLASY